MDLSEGKPARRRPAERPAEILEAAERVFIRSGYDRATTREIAAEAGVSEGTLYNYFGGKREIFIALLDMTHAEIMVESAEQLRPDGLEESLVAYIVERLRFTKEHPLTILTLQQAMLDPEIGRYLDSHVSAGQDRVMDRFRDLFDSGALRPIDPFVAEEALGSMMMGLSIGIELASRGWHREPMAPEQIARALVDVLMNGLKSSLSKEKAE